MIGSIITIDAGVMSYGNIMRTGAADVVVWAVGTVAIFPWMMLVRACFYKPQPDEPAAA